VLAGLTPEEMETKHPEVFSQWRARNPDAELPGGESLRAFNARVMHELSAIARAHLGQPVLIISHGGTLDCAYRAARGLPLESKREHSLHNASINQVSVSHGGELTLGPWGDIAHLEAASTKEQPLHSGDWKETPG
jgi:probable phosphoglycerate mutase